MQNKEEYLEIQEKCQKKSIEFNIKNQTVTTVQTSGKTFFGEFTDEVIDYCKIRRDKIKYSMIL